MLTPGKDIIYKLATFMFQKTNVYIPFPRSLSLMPPMSLLNNQLEAISVEKLNEYWNDFVRYTQDEKAEEEQKRKKWS